MSNVTEDEIQADRRLVEPTLIKEVRQFSSATEVSMNASLAEVQMKQNILREAEQRGYVIDRIQVEWRCEVSTVGFQEPQDWVEEMSEEDYPHPGALDRFRAAFRSACHRSFARINGLEPVVIDRSML